MVHTCITSTQEVEVKDCKFKAYLGYIERPCIKKKRERGTTLET
jgi:hypothetical protein